MPDCKLLAGCSFFNGMMKNMPATAELLKERYCRTDNTECARYIVFSALGRENVPIDLAPNNIARARAIVSGR